MKTMALMRICTCLPEQTSPPITSTLNSKMNLSNLHNRNHFPQIIHRKEFNLICFEFTRIKSWQRYIQFEERVKQ